jgi:hypothetical protein
MSIHVVRCDEILHIFHYTLSHLKSKTEKIEKHFVLLLIEKIENFPNILFIDTEAYRFAIISLKCSYFLNI